MSLMISQAEGVTVYTVHYNHKSKWPLICQMLGTMCYSPVCSVSQRLKQQLGCALTALATVQIMVGIMNMGFGSLFTSDRLSSFSEFGPAFLSLGGVITVVGVMCILAEKFPSPCLVVLTVMMNIVSTALAVTAIVLYSVDLVHRSYGYMCELPHRGSDSVYAWTTASPAKKAKWEKIYQNRLEIYRACEEDMLVMKKTHTSLDITMLVLAVLHFCVTISWCVLSVKALRKKKADGQDVEDPELHRSLMEEEILDPVC